MPRRTAMLTTTLLLVGLAPGVAAAGGGSGTPGAAGLGDPYYPLDGNGGYDVRHYDLDVRYDPDSDVLEGVARIRARATQHLSAFDLDLVGMEVRSVSVEGEEADWHRDGQELVITPAEVLREGRRFTVEVAYAGVPETITDAFGVSGFMHTDDGAIVAGQPHGAATWFPANDHPRDAASLSVSATVPDGLVAVSNGELDDEESDGAWTTWEWEAEEPMATYLVTLAIGAFDLREYAADGVRYWDALDPDLFSLDLDPETEGPTAGEVAEIALARQPEIIDFLSGFFGPYPYSSAGGIVDDHPEFFFALETQTRSIYAPVFFSDQVFGESVVVHELAHQWIGNLLRIDLWEHIWLNEGFAVYAEWLWLEHEGISTPQDEFDLVYETAEPEFWTTTIGDPGPAVEELFQAAVYQRGAMTLQALRDEVGDEVFFDILAEWVSGQGGGTVTTEDFLALAEKLSGQELDGLFDTWLFTPEKPAGY